MNSCKDSKPRNHLTVARVNATNSPRSTPKASHDPHSGRRFAHSHPPCSAHPGNREKSLLWRQHGTGLHNHLCLQVCSRSSSIRADTGITAPLGAPARATSQGGGKPPKGLLGQYNGLHWDLEPGSSGVSVECPAGLCISLDVY